MPDWDRRPDEPNLWYNRFDVYRLLGPHRSIERAFSILKSTDDLRAKRPGSSWYTAAKRWHWKQRAEAWDATERQRRATWNRSAARTPATSAST